LRAFSWHSSFPGTKFSNTGKENTYFFTISIYKHHSELMSTKIQEIQRNDYTGKFGASIGKNRDHITSQGISVRGFRIM